MDGNNRWSVKNNVDKYDAYNIGAKKLLKLSQKIFEISEVNYISAFALSSHNLNRPLKSIKIILKVLEKSIDNFLLNQNYDFSINFRGDLSFLNSELIEKIKIIEKKTYNKKKTLVILLNYSGRDEILNAINKISKLKKNITKKDFINCLTLGDLPDPEILIRTGGYNRLSDFSLFNISFTDFFFIKKLWPEITLRDIKIIFSKYENIERKFGK